MPMTARNTEVKVEFLLRAKEYLTEQVTITIVSGQIIIKINLA